MNTEEFQAWAGEHCRVFGLSVAEAATVLSWEPYFIASGFHHHDLADTTAALVRSPGEITRLAGESRFLGKTTSHLKAIEGYIREKSARTMEQAVPDYAAKHGSCLVCSNTGFVVVPHLKGIANGRWVGVKVGSMRAHLATCAVLCSCALGRWKANREPGTRHGGRTVLKHMSLEIYEHHNPGWREQVEAWEASRTERLKLDSGAKQVHALAERLKIWRA